MFIVRFSQKTAPVFEVCYTNSHYKITNSNDTIGLTEYLPYDKVDLLKSSTGENATWDDAFPYQIRKPRGLS